MYIVCACMIDLVGLGEDFLSVYKSHPFWDVSPGIVFDVYNNS